MVRHHRRQRNRRDNRQQRAHRDSDQRPRHRCGRARTPAVAVRQDRRHAPVAAVVETRLGGLEVDLDDLGIGIEVVQWKYIPTRTGSIDDFVADAVGIAAAFFVARAIRKFVTDRAGKAA
mgnify:CR=1 FL=1